MPFRKLLRKSRGLFTRHLLDRLRLPVFWGRLKGTTWILQAGTPSYWLGIYELRKQAVFEKVVTRGSTVFDIGAHVGFYTLLAADLVGPEGQVFAFEPVPRNLRYLRKHLRLNSIDNVTVMDMAVADSSGVGRFEEGWTPTKGRIAPAGRLPVRMTSLDELLSAGRVPLPRCVKIDVEGAELLVLTGARKMLAQAHPTLFLATHGHQTHRQCLRFLSALDYKLEPLVGKSLTRTHEVLAYTDGASRQGRTDWHD